MTIRPKTLWYHQLSCTGDFWLIGHTVGCFLKLPCESLKGKVVTAAYSDQNRHNTQILKL